MAIERGNRAWEDATNAQIERLWHRRADLCPEYGAQRTALAQGGGPACAQGQQDDRDRGPRGGRLLHGRPGRGLSLELPGRGRAPPSPGSRSPSAGTVGARRAMSRFPKWSSSRGRRQPQGVRGTGSQRACAARERAGLGRPFRMRCGTFDRRRVTDAARGRARPARRRTLLGVAGERRRPRRGRRLRATRFVPFHALPGRRHRRVRAASTGRAASSSEVLLDELEGAYDSTRRGMLDLRPEKARSIVYVWDPGPLRRAVRRALPVPGRRLLRRGDPHSRRDADHAAGSSACCTTSSCTRPSTRRRRPCGPARVAERGHRGVVRGPRHVGKRALSSRE